MLGGQPVAPGISEVLTWPYNQLNPANTVSEILSVSYDEFAFIHSEFNGNVALPVLLEELFPGGRG